MPVGKRQNCIVIIMKRICYVAGGGSGQDEPNPVF